MQHGNSDAQERLAALSRPDPSSLSRQQHEVLTETTLVRKRTQAKQRSDASGQRPAGPRQFNVNSNMWRHYRTHFTPGAFDLTELSYSTVDERFYPMAVNNISPANSTNTTGYHPLGRCNTGPYIPPMPSASYGSSFSPPPTLQSYPPLRIPHSSDSHSNHLAPYIVPITVYHNQRSWSNSTRDHLLSPPLRSPTHRTHPPSESMLVSHPKPTPDWNLSHDHRQDDSNAQGHEDHCGVVEEWKRRQSRRHRSSGGPGGGTGSGRTSRASRVRGGREEYMYAHTKVLSAHLEYFRNSESPFPAPHV